MILQDITLILTCCYILLIVAGVAFKAGHILGIRYVRKKLYDVAIETIEEINRKKNV